MKRDNMRVIATVMGEPDSSTRNSEVSSMLDYAYSIVGMKTIINKGDIVDIVELSKANKKIEIVPINDVNVLYKKVDGKVNPKTEIKLNNIKLPIKVGDVVGKLYTYNNGKLVNTTNLTVKDNIEKCNILELYLKNLKDIVVGNIKVK